MHGVGGDPLRGVHRGGLAKPADDSTVDDVLVDLDDLADDQRAQSGESAVRAVAQVAVQTLVGTPLQATTGNGNLRLAGDCRPAPAARKQCRKPTGLQRADPDAQAPQRKRCRGCGMGTVTATTIPDEER